MKANIRVWEEFDLEATGKHLVVIGELKGECFACHAIGIDINLKKCPSCGVEFKYMGFRRKVDVSSILRFKNENPDLVYIEFDDFRKVMHKKEARKLLDL